MDFNGIAPGPERYTFISNHRDIVLDSAILQPAPQPAARPNMYGPQVSDIRQAISLGDRFLFQRELFGQSGEKLQKTLDTINQMGSFDEALGYLDQNFNWDKEATAYNLFITALHRRFE